VQAVGDESRPRSRDPASDRGGPARPGQGDFAALLAELVDVRDLREEARRLGLSPKGYRVDKAPAKVLAQALADPADPEAFGEAMALFVDAVTAGGAEDDGADGPVGGEAGAQGDSVSDDGEDDPEAVRARLERQNASLLEQLESWRRDLDRKDEQIDKAQALLARARERGDRLDERVHQEVELGSRLRAEAEDLRRRLVRAERAAAADRDVTAAQRQIEELQREQQAILESEEGLRRLIAARNARVRELEATVAELEELVPKGRRRKAPPPPATEPARVRVPHLTQGFYRSLEGKERRSVERAIHAILLFCTEGPAYPGLEAKQLEGQNLWSFRAALKLRVYFRFRDDGDIEVLALGDREDQNTLLRRFKDR
jgi:hypothetical protein